MNIKIIRTRVCGCSTDGKLLIDGKKICDTTEATIHCLPSGSYTIVLRKVSRYRRKMPTVVGTGATIGIGNGIFSCHDSTILVGHHRVTGVVLHSHKCFNIIFERIRKNIERGQSVTLTITTAMPCPTPII